MLKIGVFLTIFLMMYSCKFGERDVPSLPIKAEDKVKILADSTNYTSIQWIDSTYKNCGEITEGGKMEINYKFKNTGNKPLYFHSVSASCGCTLVDKPEKAILPGDESIIKSVFNSKGRIGLQEKQITITCNTNPNIHILRFKLNVKK